MMRRMVTTVLLTASTIAATVPLASADTKVWTESSGVMILPERMPGTGTAIDRTGVRNEYVTAQIGLRADAAPTAPLAFEWTALKGPHDKEIAKAQITLFRGADIDVYKGIAHADVIDPAKDQARARKLGLFPDALVPLVLEDGTNVANKIEPEANKTLSFWVDIFIPAGTAPGDYTGSITLTSAGQTLATIPVKVTALDLEIPADSTIPSFFNLRLWPHVMANLDNYVKVVMQHRVQPTWYHYLEGVGENSAKFGWKVVDKLNPNGKGYVNLYNGSEREPSPAQYEEEIKGLKAALAHLKERGIPIERIWFQVLDEPSANYLPAVTRLTQKFVAEVPEIKGRVLCTYSHHDTDLGQQLDYFVLALKAYGGSYMQPASPGRAEWDQYRAEGKHMWFYVSNAQGVPFPTFDIQTINLAWEPRVMGWAYWREKAEGHLYWDLMTADSWKLSKGFPPGDGELIYPGHLDQPEAPAWVLVKDIKEPVVSRRLKHQREGLEEWELLKMAEAKAGRDKVNAIVDKVYTTLGQRGWAPNAYNPSKPMWSYDEGAWDAARAEVIKLLLAK